MTERDAPAPARIGRRPYCDNEGREILNELSRKVAHDPPDHIDDPGDPSLSDLLREICRDQTGRETDIWSLTGLMKHDLSFQEAVIWWWWDYAGYDLEKIHHAIQGDVRKSGSPPRNSLRNIHRILKNAARMLPDADPADVPDLDDVIANAPEPATRG